MSSDQAVFDTVQAIARIPGTNRAWDGEPPSWPNFVFWQVPGDVFYADDEGYFTAPRYVVELHMIERDTRTEARFASALRQLGTYCAENPRHENGAFVFPYRVTLSRRFSHDGD